MLHPKKFLVRYSFWLVADAALAAAVIGGWVWLRQPTPAALGVVLGVAVVVVPVMAVADRWFGRRLVAAVARGK